MQDLFTHEKPIFKPANIQQIRIPWQGSKNSISTQLLDKMLEIKPNAKYFYDLFSGGCAMSFTALQYGFQVHANDKQKSLINFLEFIFDRIKNNERSIYGIFPQEWYNFVDRAEFMKQKELETPFSQFCRIVYSFGNNQKDYMYGVPVEKRKHLAHDFIMFQCEKSLKEFNSMFDVNFTISNPKTWNERRMQYKKEWNEHLKAEPTFKEIIASGHIQNLGQIQNLGEIENLERIQKLERKDKITFSSLCYQDVIITTPPEESVIYLDPPYKGTSGYKEGKNFDYEALYTFFKESPHTVFLSEYEAPFESVLEIQKMQLMNNKNVDKRQYATEKLFWNGK